MLPTGSTTLLLLHTLLQGETNDGTPIMALLFLMKQIEREREREGEGERERERETDRLRGGGNKPERASKGSAALGLANQV